MSVTTKALTVAPREEVAEVDLEQAFGPDIKRILKRYPTKQAALLPLLWRCQEHWGWISAGMMKAVAARLELAPAFVEGVVTFYTMYQTEPPGRYLLQVCSTLSCQLCGTGELIRHLKAKLGIDFGQTTADGKFTLVDVQCLGACGEAPVIQVNNDFYTRLDRAGLDRLLAGLS